MTHPLHGEPLSPVRHYDASALAALALDPAQILPRKVSRADKRRDRELRHARCSHQACRSGQT